MTDDQYVAVIEESIARREMYLSRLWLLHDRAAERGRPAIAEWILDVEAGLNIAEAMLHVAHEGRSTAGRVGHQRPILTASRFSRFSIATAATGGAPTAAG